jgi:hypothetical protein
VPSPCTAKEASVPEKKFVQTTTRPLALTATQFEPRPSVGCAPVRVSRPSVPTSYETMTPSATSSSGPFSVTQ